MNRASDGFCVVVSCEHANNHVPRRYRGLFAKAPGVLESHCGYDPGTMVLGRRVAGRMKCPLIACKWSRLLVEVNRSLHHRGLFSEYTRMLSPLERDRIIREYYSPHRRGVEQAVRRLLRRRGVVVHLSVHSFTPVFNGKIRCADVGLLYDPQRALERAFCRKWQTALQEAMPALRVRRNYPYRGRDDGLTTDLRRRLPARRYLGIELEVNQKYPLRERRGWTALQRVLIDTLERILEDQ